MSNLKFYITNISKDTMKVNTRETIDAHSACTT